MIKKISWRNERDEKQEKKRRIMLGFDFEERALKSNYFKQKIQMNYT